uniref:K Homology domain-containing protein n=2 Tax=Octactis speculum TaxID=3111310 RepID=A0A7S2CVN0_9STRA|mmetsp:Transcript_40419/g.54997  ORF Transcript_40419/g.54997 Transcript_40419/m.54997 type:complete len:268 (+) Transcript_40419:64-867(+)
MFQQQPPPPAATAENASEFFALVVEGHMPVYSTSFKHTSDTMWELELPSNILKNPLNMCFFMTQAGYNITQGGNMILELWGCIIPVEIANPATGERWTPGKEPFPYRFLARLGPNEVSCVVPVNWTINEIPYSVRLGVAAKPVHEATQPVTFQRCLNESAGQPAIGGLGGHAGGSYNQSVGGWQVIGSIPDGLAGKFIGKKGSNIKELKKRFKCDIRLKAQDNGNGSVQDVEVQNLGPQFVGELTKYVANFTVASVSRHTGNMSMMN